MHTTIVIITIIIIIMIMIITITIVIIIIIITIVIIIIIITIIITHLDGVGGLGDEGGEEGVQPRHRGSIEPGGLTPDSQGRHRSLAWKDATG
jgi:hypothetical protein